MIEKPAGPQTILECLRHEGMSDHDIKAIMPGAIPEYPKPKGGYSWWMRWLAKKDAQYGR